MRIALQPSSDSPAALKRAATAFRPKPASTSRRVFSVRTKVELPRLPLPSTQIRTLKRHSPRSWVELDGRTQPQVKLARIIRQAARIGKAKTPSRAERDVVCSRLETGSLARRAKEWKCPSAPAAS